MFFFLPMDGQSLQDICKGGPASLSKVKQECCVDLLLESVLVHCSVFLPIIPHYVAVSLKIQWTDSSC